jgi:hypothetical protein
MKLARILDWENDGFGLEYENSLGKKNTMRLDAITYEGAIREAKLFLGIKVDNLDAEGKMWEME